MTDAERAFNPTPEQLCGMRANPCLLCPDLDCLLNGCRLERADAAREADDAARRDLG